MIFRGYGNMYRPSMYNKHDQSLEAFAKLFNDSEHFPNIKINPIKEETFIDDGQIIDLDTNQGIGFDWEYRDKYFANCNFRFDSLGQYERKIRKPSIKISIQCDSTETGIAVGWHEDWLKENRINLNLATDSVDESGTVRYTKSFKIYSYENIKEFKEMLNRAFKNKRFNKNSF